MTAASNTQSRSSEPFRNGADFRRRRAGPRAAGRIAFVPPDTSKDSELPSRRDTALSLDRQLRSIAAADARCRLLQARLARAFLETRGWLRLGFVRLSDYARERLGASARSLETDARILRALDQLPLLRAALEAGTLSWTQARLLCPVATASNEAGFLALAQSCSTRALERHLTELVRAREPDSSDNDASDDRTVRTRAIEGEALDDDPEVRWSVPISRSGQRLWRTAAELASRSDGQPLKAVAVLELVAAEASGARHSPGTATRDDAASTSMEAIEKRFRSRLLAEEVRRRSSLHAFAAASGVVDGHHWLEPRFFDNSGLRGLDLLESGELRGLDRDLAYADAFELDRRLRIAHGVSRRTGCRLAALLCAGIDQRLFRELGFATVKLYVESRLGLCARSAWNLVSVERQSRRAGATFHTAWRSGRLSHLEAAALLPVVDEGNAAAWIARAAEVTLRRLVDEVRWALEQRDHTSDADNPAPPPIGAKLPNLDLDAAAALARVQMRAHGESASDVPELRSFIVSCPLSVAILVESTLALLRKGSEARWQTFEGMIALAVLQWASTPKHRDPIFERDGWRCAVPGCSSRRNLHDHHLRFRSRGGDHARDNRITVCAAHHLHGIHAGILRARGRAPDDVIWELGCRRDMEPLLRLQGERYLC